jgi:hypothetical protein
VNSLCAGGSPEEACDFAIAFLIRLHCECQVPDMSIAFAVEGSLQVVQRGLVGGRLLSSTRDGGQCHQQQGQNNNVD